MPKDYQQTVNLKDKINNTRKGNGDGRIKSRAELSRMKRTSAIDQVYNMSEKENERDEMQKIERPMAKKVIEPKFKGAVILLVLLLLVSGVYFFFFRKGDDQKNLDIAKNWQAIKITNGEIYYGQIEDITADPVVVNNVYYNYDQQKEEKKEAAESGNLRLVKRGKETHGPDGTMSIVRSQILYMEPLSEESKVLAAILDYER